MNLKYLKLFNLNTSFLSKYINQKRKKLEKKYWIKMFLTYYFFISYL
jgi:hypothetical protein